MNEEIIKSVKGAYLLFLATAAVSIILSLSPNAARQLNLAKEEVDIVLGLNMDHIIHSSTVESAVVMDYRNKVNSIFSQNGFQIGGLAENVFYVRLYHQYRDSHQPSYFKGCKESDPFGTLHDVRVFFSQPFKVVIGIPVLDEKATNSLGAWIRSLPNGTTLNELTFFAYHQRFEDQIINPGVRFKAYTAHGSFVSDFTVKSTFDRIEIFPKKELVTSPRFKQLVSSSLPLSRLEPFWDTVAVLSPKHARAKLVELSHTQLSKTKILGLDVPVAMIGYILPSALFTLSAFFLVHVGNLRALVNRPEYAEMAVSMPWFALFPGMLPAILLFISVLLIPVLACVLILLSVWEGSVWTVRLLALVGTGGTILCILPVQYQMWQIRTVLYSTRVMINQSYANKANASDAKSCAAD